MYSYSIIEIIKTLSYTYIYICVCTVHVFPLNKGYVYNLKSGIWLKCPYLFSSSTQNAGGSTVVISRDVKVWTGSLSTLHPLKWGANLSCNNVQKVHLCSFIVRYQGLRSISCPPDTRGGVPYAFHLFMVFHRRGGEMLVHSYCTS